MKKILINIAPWQARVAITTNGTLENIYFASHGDKRLERIFFKGKVTKVLPGIQTAFVDIGQEKAGFLHISEIDRELAIQKLSKHMSLDGEEAPRPRTREKPDIRKILKEGDPILIQVSKEPVYEKGAKLTTCFTLPGRFVVLMPNIPRLGVSKKIEDRDERNRLKDIIKSQLPEGMGAIIRTTSQGRKSQEILKDLNFLIEMWHSIQNKFAKAEIGEQIHEDIDLSLQIVRDYLDDDVEAVITDNKQNQQDMYRFVKSVAPEYIAKIQLYTGPTNIFEFYGIERQIEHSLAKKVTLKSGGSLIIETTEAMTVVDVNTGKFTGKANLEDTILKTNTEAAEEVARQLRLRNIGGLIVIDFIDMALGSNRQKLFKHFEKMLREYDKFQSVVLKVSEFGLVQMTRKRSGKTLQQELTNTCSCCHGAGVVKSIQTVSYTILRSFYQQMLKERMGNSVALEVNTTVFEYLTHNEYNAILSLEKTLSCKISLLSSSQLPFSEYKIKKN